MLFTFGIFFQLFLNVGGLFYLALSFDATSFDFLVVMFGVAFRRDAKLLQRFCELVGCCSLPLPGHNALKYSLCCDLAYHKYKLKHSCSYFIRRVNTKRVNLRQHAATIKKN